MSVHQNTDPVTGGCLDCGATRENIDDNLFPTCEKAAGPNRLAIISARRELRHRENDVANMRSQMAQGERHIVHLSKTIREREAECRELAASIEKLVAG